MGAYIGDNALLHGGRCTVIWGALHCYKGGVILLHEGRYTSIYQGLSKHQEVRFTPVTKITKLIVVFWDLSGAIKNLILEDKYQTDHKKNWSAMYLFK